MDTIVNEMLDRKRYLEATLETANKMYKNVPEGKLRIRNNGKRIQYFYREIPSDRQGKYIPKNKMDLAKGLAEKDYLTRLIGSIQNELSAIDIFLEKCPEVLPEDVYKSMSVDRQNLFYPMLQTDELFAEEWQSLEYSGKDFYDEKAPLFTDRGERVRSKSEIIIANQLFKNNIPYRYECPLYVEKMGTIYPDFTILNIPMRKEIYWEHFGLMDDPEYVVSAVEKISAYEASGIFLGKQLILSFETKENPLDTREVKALISQYFPVK